MKKARKTGGSKKVSRKDIEVKAAIQFELHYGRKPTAKELKALVKGTRLSIKQVKMGGCMINYPQN